MAVQAGINNVNRELSEVYAGISGVNRKLDKWQCCIGNVNRDLLEPGYIYTMSANNITGYNMGNPFTPSVNWDEAYTGMRISNIPDNIYDSLITIYLTFSSNLQGKTLTMSVERFGYNSDQLITTLYDQNFQPEAEAFIPNGGTNGSSSPFQLSSLVNRQLDVQLNNSTSTVSNDVIVGFYVDSTPIKLI